MECISRSDLLNFYCVEVARVFPHRLNGQTIQAVKLRNESEIRQKIRSKGNQIGSFDLVFLKREEGISIGIRIFG